MFGKKSALLTRKEQHILKSRREKEKSLLKKYQSWHGYCSI